MNIFLFQSLTQLFNGVKIGVFTYCIFARPDISNNKIVNLFCSNALGLRKKQPKKRSCAFPHKSSGLFDSLMVLDLTVWV